MINTNFIQKNFPKGKLSVVHGRPSAGKTSMAVSLALELAGKGRHPFFFSMEMSKEMLAKEFVAQMGAEVPADIWANILINDTPSLKVSDIRETVANQNIDFIIIDYLQLMTCEGYNSRAEEQEQIKDELKVLASELDIPVVVLSQMSRSQLEAFSELKEFPDYEDDFEQKDDKDAYTIDKDGNVTITDSVDEIRNCLFRKRTDIKSVYIPDHIESVGILAFDECPNLKIVRINNIELLKASGLSENVIVIMEYKDDNKERK